MLPRHWTWLDQQGAPAQQISLYRMKVTTPEGWSGGFSNIIYASREGLRLDDAQQGEQRGLYGRKRKREARNGAHRGPPLRHHLPPREGAGRTRRDTGGAAGRITRAPE